SRNRRRLSLQGSAANLHVNRRRNGGETGNTRPIVRAATARYEPTALGNLRLELENRRGFTRSRLDRTYEFPIDYNFELFQSTRSSGFGAYSDSLIRACKFDDTSRPHPVDFDGYDRPSSDKRSAGADGLDPIRVREGLVFQEFG